MALAVKPNAGHYALAALARARPGFLCLSQNVDRLFLRPRDTRAPQGLTQLADLHRRANHPASQLRLLHGSLFDIKCSRCAWVEHDNFADPFFPAIAAASRDVDAGQTLPLLDPTHKLERIPADDIPACPSCRRGLQRPGVVWFGEGLDENMLVEVDRWIAAAEVDLVLVIGTSSVVWPAAGYAEQARTAGTSVATINLEAELPHNLANMEEGDFAFAGDAAELLPRLLAPVIGEMKGDGTFSADG